MRPVSDEVEVQYPHPSMLALVRSGSVDSVVWVELWGSDLVPIVFGSTPFFTLTVSTTARSLVSFMSLAGYGFPAGVVGGRIRVASGGGIACNFGSDEGGVLVASKAPTSDAPLRVEIGEQLEVGRSVGVRLSKLPGDSSGNATVVLGNASPGADTTNDRLITQPKSSAGSGGPCTNADITMHSGACTLNCMIGSCTTGGTIAVSDAVGAAGPAIVTFTFAAGDEIFCDFGGLAFGTGIFFDITTFVGSVMVCVGPAVA